MPNNAAFWPLSSTVLVGVTAVQVPGSTGTYRVRNLSASVQYFSWGNSSVSAPTIPVAGTPSANTIGMLPNSVEIFSIGANVWFIASAAAAFEFTPGEGL